MFTGAINATTVAGENGVPSKWSYGLNFPTSIIFDQFENMYILDSGNNRIQRWSSGSTYGITVLSTISGVPRGIALHPFGHVVIPESTNYRIVESSIICRKHTDTSVT